MVQTNLNPKLLLTVIVINFLVFLDVTEVLYVRDRVVPGENDMDDAMTWHKQLPHFIICHGKIENLKYNLVNQKTNYYLGGSQII